MSKRTDYFFKALNVLSWIIFIGVCIEAGAFIVNTIIILTQGPEITAKMWNEVDLSALYRANQTHFITVSSHMIIVALLRALMFYLIVKMFHDKSFNLAQPFNEAVRRFISRIAYLALGIGFFSLWAARYTENLVAEGIQIPDLHQLRLGSADVWLFMGVILLVVAQIFKKGIEIQTENDLTV